MPQLQNIFKVVSNEKLCPAFWRMCIDAPPVRDSVRPGQFIHIRVKDGLEPFFRRPFSVYRAVDQVEIFYEVVGPGTRILSEMEAGDDIDVLGPVGERFDLPGDQVQQVVMVAGGIGIAPFLILSDELKKRKGLELVLLYGGRTGNHVYEMKEFKENGCAVHVATDDGSTGAHGRVTELFDKIKCDPETTMIYTCGPNAMMAAVQRFAKEKNLRGQAACEEVMACALGACLGCSIPTTEGYKTVCYDGPVFELETVLFDKIT